jgi:predicted phosphate transport protein (TIGR00153 family)
MVFGHYKNIILYLLNYDMGFKEWIIPQDKVFFNLLEEQAKLVLQAAELFKDMVDDYDTFGVKMKRMRALEHDGDEIVHEIFHKLNKTFITPIDQEDISRLASLYDDILDYIDAVANKIYLFKIEKPDGVIKDFSEIIVKMVEEVNAACRHIRKIKQKEIEEKFKEVHKLENQADDLADNAIAKLFTEKDPVKILIMKDIYELLEEVTDKIEDVCLAIQDIVMKNA